MTDATAILRSALADRYAIEREVGRGGMAVVYLARDLRHDRLVALKVLRPELALALGGDRFQREIRVTAALKHPHILPLFDSGETNGMLWYTAPYVEGESLRARLTRDGMLPVEEALQVASQVADALGYAHAAGVVHRDIKPGNVLMLGRHAVVADFGISQMAGTPAADKLTETGLSIGTPGYMSPEQATGARVDHRSDIYSLGVMVYEMLAGEPPFGGPNSKAIIARQLTGRAPRLAVARPGLPAHLDDAVARALAVEPADRYQTAGEFGAAILPGPATRPQAEEHRAARPRWIGLAATAAVVALAAVAAVLWMLRDRRAALPTEAATTTDPRMVAVMPFASSGADTALDRLGRDLVFTLSAALDGVGDLRTADAHSILAQASSGAALHSVAEAVGLARRLGAGRLLTGSLVRVGDDVRIDGLVHEVGDSGSRVRASFTGAPDSVVTLTDSLAQRVLPALLRGGAIQETSLESALRTRSVEALRAFLEGEQLLAASSWDDAAAAYARAWRADSTFWLAAARLAFTLEWALKPVPAVLRRELVRNAASLPPRERLEFAAIQASDSGVSVSAQRFRDLVTRYPTSWFGWFAYGDLLAHHGPLFGQPLASARPMFARTLELNPALVPAWEHDLMLAAADGDGARVRAGLAALERLGARPEDQYGNPTLSFRLLRALIEGDSAGIGSALDSVVADKVSAGRFAESFYEPMLFGFPRAQIALVRGVLARGGGAVAEAPYREVEAYSLGAAAAWDSAIATMPDADLAYGLAVLAAALGERSWDSAAPRPDPTAGGSDRLFLDGVASFGRGDSQGLELAARRLAARREASAAIAANALGFYGLVLRGDTARGRAALAELEWRLAERQYQEVAGVTFLPVLNRWFAARWLEAAGDTAQARRLLLLSEGRFLLHSALGPFLVLHAALKRSATTPP